MAAKAVVLDPQMKILLDTFNAAGPMFLRAETPEQARAKMRALMEANPIPVEEIYRAENRSIPGVAGDIPVRIYTPEGNAPMGVLVYYHGGGWVLGDLESHDRVWRATAAVLQSSSSYFSIRSRIARSTPLRKRNSPPTATCSRAATWNGSGTT